MEGRLERKHTEIRKDGALENPEGKKKKYHSPIKDTIGVAQSAWTGQDQVLGQRQQASQPRHPFGEI